MQFHQLQQNTPSKHAKRVGRGGKRGKTAGRGTKGQKARAGHRIRPEARDRIKKLPKRRGYGKNRARTVNDAVQKPLVINLGRLERATTLTEVISPHSLITLGIIRRHKGVIPAVKLLGDGAFSKKIRVSGILVSESARRKIEQAGGKVL